MSTALCRRNASQLVLIDVQEKLCGVMKPAMLEVVAANCSILLQAAKLQQVSTQYTEQAPTKLGATLPELAQHLDKQWRDNQSMPRSLIQMQPFAQI